jgi:hypothetical protein
MVRYHTCTPTCRKNKKGSTGRGEAHRPRKERTKVKSSNKERKPPVVLCSVLADGTEPMIITRLMRRGGDFVFALTSGALELAEFLLLAHACSLLFLDSAEGTPGPFR